MSPDLATLPILELRVALTAQDYEGLVRFYCTGLGLVPVWRRPQGDAVSGGCLNA